MKTAKKMCMLTGILLMTLLLAGWGAEPVELLEDFPLVDLNQAIKNADLGNQGNGAESGMNPTGKETYHVTVYGELVKFEDIECRDMEALKKYLVEKCSDGSVVELKDDYAEKHKYQEVSRVIEELSRTQNFEFLRNDEAE